MNKRSKEEIEARVALVADSSEFQLSSCYDDCEKATRGKSPSSSFTLAFQMAKSEGNPYATAIAKAVRWKRILERDF